MPTIIRDKNATMTASLEDLNYTFRELRGIKDHPGFKDVAAARVQVQMAIMASEGVVGRDGVPQNTNPVAKTVSELGRNPYQPGTMSYELHEQVYQQEPIKPRSELPEEQRPKKVVLRKVRATFAGTSRVQEGSVRHRVLQAIQDAKNHTATVEELEAVVGVAVRGYLQKLLEKNHIEPVEEKK